MRHVYQLTTILGFFFVCGALVTFSIISRNEEDPQITQARVQKDLAKIRLEQHHLQRNDWLYVYGTAAVVATACLCGLILASGIHRAKVKLASVHTYRIANSEFVVHERDLSLAWPVASGLVNAEKLEKNDRGIQKAFDLYMAMADVQTQQIKALVGHRCFQPALHPAPEADSPPHQALPIPTFRDLIQSGMIAYGKPLVFGYTATGPKTGTWQDIFSNATGGQGGSGKTNTLRGLILQSILQGVQFWILDYHWPHDESLLASLGNLKDSPSITYADKHIDYVPILEEVDHTIDIRIRKKESCEVVKVLAIDEVLQVVKHISYTEDIIERIGTEGRKLNVFGLFSAQSWKADKVNTTARDNLTSIFAHHMTKNQANILLQDIEQAKMVSKLKSGQMLYRPVNGDPEILNVPLCDPEAVRLVANMVAKLDNGGNVARPGNTSDNGKATNIQTDSDIVASINHLLTNPDLSVSQIANQIQINKGHLSRVLRGERSLTPEIRGKLERWKQHYETNACKHRRK